MDSIFNTRYLYLTDLIETTLDPTDVFVFAKHTPLEEVKYHNAVITVADLIIAISSGASGPIPTTAGNTLLTCITDIFVSNINSCSPLNINATNLQNVFIVAGGGSVGIGTNALLLPDIRLQITGADDLATSYSLFCAAASLLTGMSFNNDGFLAVTGSAQISWASTNPNMAVFKVYSQTVEVFNIDATGAGSVQIGNVGGATAAKLYIQTDSSGMGTYGIQIWNTSFSRLFAVRDDGVTSFSTLAGSGDRLVFADGSGIISTITTGIDGDILTITGGVPVWSAPGGGTDWTILGNANIVDGTNFIGTTNDVPFNIRVNNQRAGRISSNDLDITAYGQLTGDLGFGGSTGSIAFGYSALTNGGGFCSAIGRYALTSNTTGGFNVAVGDQALYSNTTASGNTAIGALTLVGNTASFNTAVGYRALSANTTGIGNVAIGADALISNDISGFNTAIGYQSLWTNTGGSNTAVGYNSLFSNTLGSFNIALGRLASFANTTGNNNVVIGDNAGHDNTIGIGNVFIGYQAGYFETTSGKLYISNTNTTTPLIYGDFATSQIGLGTNAPDATAKLQVDSTTQGIRFPRMTTAQRTAMANVTGVHVYDTDLNFMFYNDGTNWLGY